MLEFLILAKIHRVEDKLVVCTLSSFGCKRFVVVKHYNAEAKSISLQVEAAPKYKPHFANSLIQLDTESHSLEQDVEKAGFILILGHLSSVVVYKEYKLDKCHD